MVDKPSKTHPRLFLIDGYALIYRAYFAMINRPLVTTKGENSSAAFGIARFLMKILAEHEPDYIGVVLDAGSSQREELYPAYKATREKMPDDLATSLWRIRQIIEAFRIPVIELPDHEADDVIGTLALAAVEQGLEAVIVSGDKDFYQLIRDRVCLLNPGRGGAAGVEEEWVDTKNARERLGVEPTHVIDYLALIGDSSDNVPGARGIGPKTAIQLIEQYGDVESILAAAPEIKAKRARESLLSGADDVRLSKRLVTIITDLPVELDLEALRVCEPDARALRDVFLDLEFHSLLREVEDATGAAEVELKQTYSVVSRAAELAPIIEAARAAGRVAIAVIGEGDGAMRAHMVGIALSVEPGTAWYLPLGHRRPGELDLGDASGIANLPPLSDPSLRPLVELLEDASILKIGQDLKFDLLMLRRAGVAMRGIDYDVTIASYVIDPGRRDHSVSGLAIEYMKYRTRTLEDVAGKGRDSRPLSEVTPAQAMDFACEKADLSLRLQQRTAEELESYDLMRLFREIEMPLLPVLAEMEWHGILIDRDFFASMSRELSHALQLTTEEIFKIAGEEFNISSTPQLRTILFEKLELPIIRKTKTGPSTDASVLEELATQGHAIPRLILEYRELDKLKGTYVDALPQAVNPLTGRIHTTFQQTVAATGRLSSADPNLQNIPIRTDQGRRIRKGFIPDAGNVFVTADYSQIELRILAHMSGDPAFVEAFRSGADIHRQTAAIMFGMDLDNVTADMRAAAKTVNFATIYGIGAFALSHQLGTSVAEAKEFIENYFQRFPDVRRYLDTQVEKARDCGYVETLSGRRRYIPEIRSSNYNIRQFGERAATNAPVQGSAADIIKIAMIRIHDALADSGARMLLQVHDELVFEAPRNSADEVRAMIEREMTGAFPLDVPLEVVTGVGENWYECK
ncbi:MAG TPA: DNA polymerase I [Longimicrobiales bacterium]|nr:DNA polymerase I [Longimicrobiales bacterium]